MTSFERLTDEARAIIVGSDVRARALRQQEITGAHLLLALLDKPESAVAQELGELGITSEAVLVYYADLNPVGPQGLELPKHLGYSPVFKKATDQAYYNATKPEYPSYTDGLGLLLALAQVADDEMVALFAHFDVDFGTIEQAVTRRRQRDRDAAA